MRNRKNRKEGRGKTIRGRQKKYLRRKKRRYRKPEKE
jgi:hypothetical protein